MYNQEWVEFIFVFGVVIIYIAIVAGAILWASKDSKKPYGR